MNEFVFGLGWALWLGVWTSLGPCAMATNVVAISYIGRKVGDGRHVLLTGMLYTIGCSLAYVGLSALLVTSVLSVPRVSLFLQKYMHLAVGPLLIVVGVFLLELVPLNVGSAGMSEAIQKRADSMGIWGALLLGIVFGLTFCPTSAALFFGTLVPLSIRVNSRFAMPLVYGIGTALPVMLFAVLLATGAQYVGRAYDLLARVEKWTRAITGWVFVLVGIYFSLKYVFGVL